MFFKKGVVQICRTFTEEYPYKSVIPLKLFRSSSALNLLHICKIKFLKITSEALLLTYHDEWYKILYNYYSGFIQASRVFYLLLLMLLYYFWWPVVYGPKEKKLFYCFHKHFFFHLQFIEVFALLCGGQQNVMFLKVSSSASGKPKHVAWTQWSHCLPVWLS